MCRKLYLKLWALRLRILHEDPMTISIGNHLKKSGITHITSDSRQVQKGSAFFAVSEEYIDQAIELGAKMIVFLGRSFAAIRGS